MSQQFINIGSAANDGTGDQLRTAFDKSNDNFTELYAVKGNVSNTGTPVDNQIAVWTAAATIEGNADLTWNSIRLAVNGSLTVGNTSSWLGWGLEVLGINASAAAVAQELYSNDANAPQYYFDKSRGGSLNTYTAVTTNDFLGQIKFRGADATAMRDSAAISCLASGAPVSGRVPSQLIFNVTGAAGAAINPLVVKPTGVDVYGDQAGSAASAGFVGEVLTASGSAALNSGVSYVALTSLSIPAGDWDVWGIVQLSSGGTSGAFLVFGISPTANSPSGVLYFESRVVSASGFCHGHTAPAVLRPTTTTTYYLNAFSSSGTPTPTGTIIARRRR